MGDLQFIKEYNKCSSNFFLWLQAFFTFELQNTDSQGIQV